MTSVSHAEGDASRVGPVSVLVDRSYRAKGRQGSMVYGFVEPLVMVPGNPESLVRTPPPGRGRSGPARCVRSPCLVVQSCSFRAQSTAPSSICFDRTVRCGRCGHTTVPRVAQNLRCWGGYLGSTLEREPIGSLSFTDVTFISSIDPSKLAAK